MKDLIAELERALPSDREVLLAAAVNPLAFLAIHGVCASDYIAELQKARKVIAALKARQEDAK